MSELTISGHIALILPLQQGTSKTGNPWKKQGYIIDTGGQYPKKVCFSLFGDKIDQFPLQVGQDVTVSIGIESREFNGRWYTEVNAWNVAYSGQQPQLQAQPAPQPPVEQPAPSTPPKQQAADNLPF